MLYVLEYVYYNVNLICYAISINRQVIALDIIINTD